MEIGQVVIGPPGSGKTTYCNGMSQFLSLMGRKVAIVNLDPANYPWPYPLYAKLIYNDCSWCHRKSSMCLVYCMEYLEKNIDWLDSKLKPLLNAVNLDFLYRCSRLVILELYLSQDPRSAKYSSSKTWDQIRKKSAVVAWSSLVWTPNMIPSRAFITWLAMKNKLSTGERMRMWGLTQVCEFCGDTNESRDHLFFRCSFTSKVWTEMCGSLYPGINSEWLPIQRRFLRISRKHREDYLLSQLMLQITNHGIWRERNNRRHSTNRMDEKTLYRLFAKDIVTKLNSLAGKDLALRVSTTHRWNSTRT